MSLSSSLPRNIYFREKECYFSALDFFFFKWMVIFPWLSQVFKLIFFLYESWILKSLKTLLRSLDQTSLISHYRPTIYFGQSMNVKSPWLIILVATRNVLWHINSINSLSWNKNLEKRSLDYDFNLMGVGGLREKVMTKKWSWLSWTVVHLNLGTFFVHFS